MYARLPAGAKPSRAVLGRVLPGSASEILRHGHLTRDGDVWVLVVTDSYSLAVLPLDVHEDDGPELVEGLISAEALRAIEKAGECFRAHEQVEPLNAHGVPVGQMFARPGMPGETRFPSHQVLIGDPGEFRITLNARILHRLAQALGDERVTIAIERPRHDAVAQLRPMHVSALRHSTRRGLLMPIAEK